MKKKLLLISAVFIMFASPLSAYTKGYKSFGIEIIGDDTKAVTASYFIIDNFSLGLSLDFNFSFRDEKSNDKEVNTFDFKTVEITGLFYRNLNSNLDLFFGPELIIGSSKNKRPSPRITGIIVITISSARSFCRKSFVNSAPPTIQIFG